MSEPTRADAWELLCEWTDSEALRKHALAVEASMRHYARIWGEDEELYGITGLVHDLDYERFPDLDRFRHERGVAAGKHLAIKPLHLPGHGPGIARVHALRHPP